MRRMLIALLGVALLTLAGRVVTAAQQGFVGESEKPVLSRMDLVVPDEIWERVCDNVGYADRPLGYTVDEMAHFRGSDCILRNVEMLFRDISSVPQFSGLITDAMLDNPANFASCTFEAWKLIDAYAARVLSYDPLEGWGVDWIPQDADIDEAMNAVMEKGQEDGIDDYLFRHNRSRWEALPDPVKKLTIRILIASIEAAPWLIEAFDACFYEDYFDVEELDEATYTDLYGFAGLIWQDGAPEPTPRECFEALDRFDMKLFATGSNEFMRMAYLALDEYKASGPTETAIPDDFGVLDFWSPMGLVGIFGPGSDIIQGGYSLIIDLGGDDTYSYETAIPRSMTKPISLVVDLGGNDTYDSGDLRAALACGNHGVGAILDLEGSDVYRCDEAGIASAWFGTGLVVDYEGDDEYHSRTYSQGMAYAGVGMLIDLDGDDYYDTIENGQAFAHTYGCGVLLDAAGDDVYYADPRGHISELYEGRTVNFVQGSAQGRRADFYDGHSLGGGIGILADGDGDDSYTGSCYAQGNAYWWALGILEDRAGNDTYANEQYSAGSAPHFAIGCLVDLLGDDKYNVGNDPERQIQAHARDGSLAVFMDGSGNDEYFLPNLAAGSSDLNCLTLFWDREGNDRYTADRNPPSAVAYSFGDSTRYEPFHTFRDTMASIGIFLDTGGVDTYVELGPEDEEAAESLTRIPFADNSEWIQRDEHPNYGYGLDTEWFAELISIAGGQEE